MVGSGGVIGSGEARPELRAWSLKVQRWFGELPAATGRAGSAAEVCSAAVGVLEKMKPVLLPSPSLDLDQLLVEYLEKG